MPACCLATPETGPRQRALPRLDSSCAFLVRAHGTCVLTMDSAAYGAPRLCVCVLSVDVYVCVCHSCVTCVCPQSPQSPHRHRHTPCTLETCKLCHRRQFSEC